MRSRFFNLRRAAGSPGAELYSGSAARTVALWVGGLFLALGAAVASPPVGTPIVNRAVVTYADANGNARPLARAEVSTVLSGAPVLTVQKLDSTDPVAIGATLTYTITYANTGNVAATGVVITDQLSKHVIFQTASNGGVFTPGPPNGGTVTWNLGAVNPGTGGSITLVVQVKTPGDYAAGDPDTIRNGTVIFNTARVNSAEGLAAETITTTVGQSPRVELTKSGTPRNVSPGGTITYTVQYTNGGNAPASQFQLRDELPVGTALVPGSVTGGGRVEGRTLIWDLGNLPSGGQGEVSYQVTVSPLANGGTVVSNSASAVSREQGAVLSNEVITYVTVITVNKLDDPDPVRVGNLITYTIQVTNNSGTPLTNVTVRDPVPAKTEFVSATDGGTLNAAEVVWNLGEIAPKVMKSIQLVVRVSPNAAEGDLIQNSAVATTNEIPMPVGSAATTVSARTPGAVKFFDAAWNPTHRYSVGDTIYIQVTDDDQNQNPSAIETVFVTLTVQNGDTERIVLTETGPNTGIFRGSIGTTGAQTNANDARLSVSTDSRIVVVYDDPLDANPVSEDVALIDPYGVVFDSVTGDPVSGVVVILRRQGGALGRTAPGWPAGQADTVTTGTDGRFAFPLVPAGRYYLDVRPDDKHLFPSRVPTRDLPSGFVVATGSRGELFSLTAGMPPLNLDVPVDPEPGQLRVAKTANKTTASLGDIVQYTVTVTREGSTRVTSTRVVDTMPHGFQYLKGSTLIDGRKEADPERVGRNGLVWPVRDLGEGKSSQITYRVVLGADSQRGNGRNTAYAHGRSVGRRVTSNTASFTIKITEGVFTTKGTIIGKVFLDLDQNTIQNRSASGEAAPDSGTATEPVMEPAADTAQPAETPRPEPKTKTTVTKSGEVGLEGIAIYLEDGTRVITDKDGKFSIHSVNAGTHVLRVDETTLPPGVHLAPVSNRFMGDSASQFVDIPSSGGLFKANFAAQRSSDEGTTAQASGQPGSQEGSGTPASDGGDPTAQKARPATLEELILNLTPDLDFVSPTDGSTLGMTHTNVVVKAPVGGEVTLVVNGRKIEERRIGKRVTNAPKRVALYEYISVDLEPGEANQLEVSMVDPFGNPRGSKSIAVRVAGRPEKIEVLPERSEIPADGRSTARVRVSILDQNGLAVPYPVIVTVATTAGEILDPDVDKSAAGHQIRGEAGVAEFQIRSAREPGEAEITGSVDDVQARTRIYFSPHLRNMFIVGLGELTFGSGNTRGDSFRARRESWLEDGTYVGGKAAVFLKGQVAKDILLTATYDTEKPEQDDFFREADKDLDAEDKYPIYGDESQLGYEAQSRDKLYVRVDKGKSYIMYGDYHTDLSGTKLSPYTRTFTGLKGEVQTERTKTTFFGAETDQVQVIDQMRGKAISGYYFLTRNQVVEGSEKVVIEVRDRQRPDRVLRREAKNRSSDYEVDYELGAILFKQPVPSRDANLNPVFITVSYESEGATDQYYTYGGRSAVRITPWMELGVTGVREEQDANDYELIGTDITLKLPRNSTLKAEWAQTDSALLTENVLEPASDSAWSVEFESRPITPLHVSAYYRLIGEEFDNPSATDTQRGTQKYGIESDYRLNATTLLKGVFFNEKDNLNNTDYTYTGVGAEKEIGKAKLGVELSRETSDDHFVPADSPTTREPFDTSEETPEELTALRAAFETPIGRKFAATLSHKQDIVHNDYAVSQAGINYLMGKTGKLYLRQERGDFDDRVDYRTVFGAESEVAKNTVAYNDYRLDSGADGSRTQQVLGLRNQFHLGETITGNLSGENLTTVRGEERQGEADGFAVAAAIEYLPGDRSKATSRLEYRNVTDEQSVLAEAGLAYKLHPDYSILLRERFFWDELDEAGKRTTSRTLIGLAYRPIENDQFNALAKLEYKSDHNSTLDPDSDTDAYIGSIEAVQQIRNRITLIGRYSCKYAIEDELNAFTDLIAGRAVIDITSRIDFGVEYRILNSHDVGSMAHGGSVELGCRIIKNLWLSVGYQFDEFDPDLTRDGYRGEGFFVRLRMKFDEKTLKEIKERAKGHKDESAE